MRAEERARIAWQDALARLADAEGALRAASDRGSSAADRTASDAHRAKLRDRVVAARQLVASREALHQRASSAVETSRGSLGAAHGEHRIAQGRLDRFDGEARANRVRKEEDEADELAGRKRD